MAGKQRGEDPSDVTAVILVETPGQSVTFPTEAEIAWTAQYHNGVKS